MNRAATTWVFGYGSLVWRPAFPHSAVVPAALAGFKRRFWQHSPDHRGTPENPGRVVTLLREPGARTVGVAYLVQDEHASAVLGQLDHREKAGYERAEVQVTALDDGRAIEALVYIAGSGNSDFAGELAVEKIAQQVVRSVGPSGDNVSYVLGLAESLRALNEPDPHVEALVAAIERQGRLSP